LLSDCSRAAFLWTADSRFATRSLGDYGGAIGARPLAAVAILLPVGELVFIWSVLATPLAALSSPGPRTSSPSTYCMVSLGNSCDAIGAQPLVLVAVVWLGFVPRTSALSKFGVAFDCARVYYRALFARVCVRIGCRGGSSDSSTALAVFCTIFLDWLLALSPPLGRGCLSLWEGSRYCFCTLAAARTKSPPAAC